MDIEAIVKKHFDRWVTDTEFGNVEVHLRAALTEQAAEYDRKQALLFDAHCDRVAPLQERISQLDAERLPGGMIPVFEVGTGWLTPHHQERGTILYAAAPAPKKEGE